MHRRRGVGVSAVRKKQASEERYASLADKLEATRDEHIADYLASFRVALEAFARKHKKKIRSDAVFRTRFTEMCADIGVDPLQSSKGVWAEMLGVGDFYYELGIKIIDVCAATRGTNGGLLSLDELEGHLNTSSRGSNRGDTTQRVTREDVKRAIAKLDVLGDGFRIVDDAMVLSVPTELNRDHVVALDVARRSGAGRVTASALRERLPHCSAERADHLLAHLAKDGLAWVDDGPPVVDSNQRRRRMIAARDERKTTTTRRPNDDDDRGGGPHHERAYYFPSIWLETMSSSPDSPPPST